MPQKPELPDAMPKGKVLFAKTQGDCTGLALGNAWFQAFVVKLQVAKIHTLQRLLLLQQHVKALFLVPLMHCGKGRTEQT